MDTDDIVLVGEPSMKLITSSQSPSRPCQAVPQMSLEWNHRPHLEIGGKSFTFTDKFWGLYRALSLMDKLKTPEPTLMFHIPSELAHGEKSRDRWTKWQTISGRMTALVEEEERERIRPHTNTIKVLRDDLESLLKKSEMIRRHNNAIKGFRDELESLSKEPILRSADELSEPTDKIRYIPPLSTLAGISFEQSHLSLEDARMRNMFHLYRLGEITYQRRGHITTQRKMSPKLPLLSTFAAIGVPCAALLYTPHWLGSKRALAGVVSGSAGIALPSLPEEHDHRVLRFLVQVLWAVTYLAFLRLSYTSLPVNRPIYLFCSLLLAAHFGLGIAGSADSNAEAVRVILGFCPLVTTACAALMYIPFRYAANVVADRSPRAVDAGDVEMGGSDERVPRANTHGDIGLERPLMYASTGFNL